ncbi:hypothetical protein [Mucilaginibacter sp.]|uniref:hypothetical protein n=1 Tax=Mucilaginibacter sp. TaxID=1882438 RepID=UPI003D0C80C8
MVLLIFIHYLRLKSNFAHLSIANINPVQSYHSQIKAVTTSYAALNSREQGFCPSVRLRPVFETDGRALKGC